MPVTEQQARALAFLAIGIRPHGAPRWDEAGVYANVMKVADRSLAAVTIAVVQAAEDRAAITPGVIPTAGPHWRAPAPGDQLPERLDRAQRCKTCGKSKAACLANPMNSDPDDGHTFEPDWQVDPDQRAHFDLVEAKRLLTGDA